MGYGKPFVASLETYWNRDSNYYDNEWRGTWKGERGGAILGHAIHIHDLLTMVFGEYFLFMQNYQLEQII